MIVGAHLNSPMMASRSFWGMSPCMALTVKLFCRIFSVSQSTFRLVLQKMTACVIAARGSADCHCEYGGPQNAGPMPVLQHYVWFDQG